MSGLRVDPQPQPRRLRELPFLLVVAGVALGLVVVALDEFRWGSVLMGLAVLGGALARAVLPEREAGLLVVRSRAVDVLALAALGGGLIVLTLVVPPPT